MANLINLRSFGAKSPLPFCNNDGNNRNTYVKHFNRDED
jgi:hypothetical protein